MVEMELALWRLGLVTLQEMDKRKNIYIYIYILIHKSSQETDKENGVDASQIGDFMCIDV